MTMPTQAALIRADGTAEEWPDSVAETLERYDLLQREGDNWVPSDDFALWLRAVIDHPEPNTMLHEHRFVPGTDKSLFLALLPWQEREVFALHLLETDIINTAQQTINSLTQREVDVLHWLSEGKSNESIAQILEISDGTVRKHVENILKKLHVENRTEAARFYMDMWKGLHH